MLDQLGDVDITGFRFIQTSDNFVEEDGFIVDDFTILGFPAGSIGDFNSDNSVDILDVLGLSDLLLFGAEPTDYQLFISDLDGNGDLDIMDLILFVNQILGL